MKTRHIAVLMGGTSAEHGVSLNSGRMVMRNLKPDRFRATPVVIEKDGAWRVGDSAPCPVHEGVSRLAGLGADCVFLALHGPGGEDGRMQGLLDLLGIAYTGSPHAASALCMDKIQSKAVVAGAGLPVASQRVVTRAEWVAGEGALTEAIGSAVGFPCVVKSPCEGSSLGMGIPQSADELPSVMATVFTHGSAALIEQFIEGRELTCGVLETAQGQPEALPVTEIRPVSSAYFDFRAKYTPGATEEITPAPIPDTLRERVQEIALTAHRVLGCRGFSRSDMIARNGEEPVWIEINTIPGMTETSLFPQAAAAAGIPFASLVTLLIDNALARAGIR